MAAVAVTSLSALIAQVEARKREILDIRDALFTGGYDGTEGQRNSPDMTWTDFGIAVGHAETGLVLAAALKDALPIMCELLRLLWHEDLHWKLHPTDDEINEAEAVAKELASFLERHKEEAQ